MAAMASSDQPRVIIIALALFFILILVGAGITAMVFYRVEAGAIMLGAACLSLTLLARPTR